MRQLVAEMMSGMPASSLRFLILSYTTESLCAEVIVGYSTWFNLMIAESESHVDVEDDESLLSSSCILVLLVLMKWGMHMNGISTV